MRLRELERMVHATADPAFATDAIGAVVAWNAGAEELFGVSAADALGEQCGRLLKGEDECGPFCRPGCAVRQSVCDQRPAPGYDLRVQTPAGSQWCRMAIVPAEVDNADRPHALHLVQPMDTRKRLELLLRDFRQKPPQQPAHAAGLSPRETEVLRLLARGGTSAAIAAQLRISRATVNNHVQRILGKLHAHTRLEAVRRAEAAGLI